METPAAVTPDLVGSFRTFGADGPAYQVVTRCDDEVMRVRVLETGEELDYPSRQALADPEAA